ncbi:MAG: PLP-dependent aspartate aminotransferase family protein [Candidatus Thermoplasmatota archaeon]|nr:PLP-dependent aspartate aminotransferase family protein [Candidatus Thermoplasmatota archaeon]
MRMATRAIHAGQKPDSATGAVNVPIFMTSTYSQSEQEEYVYGRGRNPTREALEESLATLEEGTRGLAFASGMAAITTVMTLLKQGDHVVVEDSVYGGTYRLFRQVMEDFGVSFDFVDMTDMGNAEAAIREDTRMLWAESPTNPLLKVVDLKALGDLGKERGVYTVVDNTFASPYLQQPLKLGVDIVVHSTTKYLGGHSDILGGAVVTSHEKAHERLRFAQNAVGAIPSPFDCFLVLRGIRTLPLRMDRHSANAMLLAHFLQERKEVEWVAYPGLEEHPQYAIAKAQMRAFGGMVSFALAGKKEANAFLKALRLIILGESLGGIESLIEHPASMTHKSVPRAEREAQGIGDGLIRFSVGCEDATDLLEDLIQGFDALRT